MIDRINKIIEANNMSTTQFADSINIQRPSMSHIIAGRNNPSLDFVAKVLKAFPDIDPDWLIFGTGKMYRNKTNENISTEVNDPNIENLNDYDLFSTPIDTTNNIQNGNIVKEPVIEINESEESVIYSKQSLQTSKSYSELKNQEDNSITNQKNDSDEVIKEYLNNSNHRGISKIVFFYSDKTFSEYFPEK